MHNLETICVFLLLFCFAFLAGATLYQDAEYKRQLIAAIKDKGNSEPNEVLDPILDKLIKKEE